MSRSYLTLRWLVRSLMWIFFRRIEVSGLENVPATGGGVIVAWHPNALIDPALIFACLPRPIVFGARHGLFDWPVIGRIMRRMGCVPFYRPQDFPADQGHEARQQANRKSLAAMADAVAGGAFTALFPEGLSHDDPAPRAVRPGAARLVIQATERTPADQPAPVVVPVGLHYNDKHVLGSGVLVVFYPPLDLGPREALLSGRDNSEADRRKACDQLTSTIEQSLREAAHATESWEVHQLLHRARKLIRAERAARTGSVLEQPDLAERSLAFRRLWTGYNERSKSHPEAVRNLLARILRYDTELEALGIDDHELDPVSRRRSTLSTLRLVIRFLFVFPILPPILVIGYLVNIWPAIVVWEIIRRRAKEEKDEATIKILSGIVAFPIAWIVAATIAVALIEGPAWLIATLTIAFSMLGGVLTFNYHRFALRAMRAMALKIKHRDEATALERLRRERSALCDELLALSTGLELPGNVEPDGRVLDR